MKLEITEPIELSEEETALVAAHSLFNAVNVLASRFLLLENAAGRPGGLSKSLEICRDLISSFHSREKTRESIDHIESLEAVFREEVDHILLKALEDSSFIPARCEEMDKLAKNIEGVMDVLHTRVRELFLLREAPGEWISIQAEDIKSNLRLFLEAVAANSRGRFGIVYEEGDKTDSGYLVQLSLSGVKEDGSMFIPIVLQDTLRDLVANARKYTTVGGRIKALLECNENEVVLEVSDNGLGIPEGEIAKSVRFGYRASNVEDRETKGGGFGLTKAYYVVRKFGGRMWIDSSPGNGTAIMLRIPKLER
ncbi:MAG: ATP-binding protein [Nitrospinae bacterium]|nr:ATP-binding protein [Nitrospinota bacterium]